MPHGTSRTIWRRTWAAMRILRSAYRRFDRDDGTAMAGYIAYSVFLSLFPFLIFMTALAGVVIGQAEAREVLDALFALAPDHIAQTLAPVVSDVIGQSRGGVLTFSALGAIWIASNAAEALRVAFDRAYDSEAPASFLRRRGVAILFVFIAALIFAALGLVIIVAPLAIRLAETYLGFAAPGWVNFARYALGLTVFTIFLLALNRWLPSRAPKWKLLIPGALVSTFLWIVGAAGFSVYLAYAPDYTVTYGAFAGVIVTLLFFYLTGAAVIFGAEVNAALMAYRLRREQKFEEVG